MDDLSFPSPKETPSPSSSPSPSETTTESTSGSAAPPAPSSAGAKKTTRKTSRRRSTSKRKSSRSRSTGVESGAPKTPKQPPAPEPLIPKITPERVDVALENIGELAHGGLLFLIDLDERHAPELGRFTAQERKQLAPPLANIINRNARLVAVAEKSDEVLVALTLMRYGSRNFIEARAGIALQVDEKERSDAVPG